MIEMSQTSPLSSLTMQNDTSQQSTLKTFSKRARGREFSSTVTASDTGCAGVSSGITFGESGALGGSSRVTLATSFSDGSSSNFEADVLEPFTLSFPPDADTEMSTALAIPTPPTSPVLKNKSGSYTAASVLVKEKVGRIIAEMEEQFSLFSTKDDMDSGLPLMHESSWRIRDNDNEFIITPDGCPNLYVRPCYQDVYSILDERWRGRKAIGIGVTRHCALITGTPGIGKSIFGHVLSKRLMQRKEPALILYQAPDCDFTEIFWQGRCFGATYFNAARLVKGIVNCDDLYSKTSHDADALEIWSIADSQLPMAVPSINRVCISSPGRTADVSSRIKMWVKTNLAVTLTLPPCEWDEIVCIREAMFGDSADKECPLTPVKERYTRWGGVPRTLLQDPSLLVEAQSKFRRLKIADALPYLGTYSLDHQRHSGTVFHLFPAFKMTEGQNWSSLFDKYSKPCFWWATETLERQSWLRFRSEQEANVIDFIETLSHDSITRGKAWEYLIHHYIEVSGLRGTLRNLETGDITNDFFIPPTACAFFKYLVDIDSSADYWRPDSSQLKTCDSYLPSSGLMVQMTVGKQHPINISGLEEILKSNIFQSWQENNPDEKLRLIFIVHKSVFNNFGKQSYKYNDGDANGNSITAAKNRLRNNLNIKEERKRHVEAKVTQYVLGVDLEQTLKRLRHSVKRERADDSEVKDEQKRQKRGPDFQFEVGNT